MMMATLKQGDVTYVVKRILPPNTSDDVAMFIHNHIETETLLRDNSGKWYCCDLVREAEFRDTRESDFTNTLDAVKTIASNENVSQKITKKSKSKPNKTEKKDKVLVNQNSI